MAQKAILGVVVAAIVVVLLLVVPFIPVSEAYTAQEPYQRQCNYQVVSANQADSIDWFGKWAYHWVRVKLENKDTQGGVFRVRFYASSGELSGEKTVEHFVGPGAVTEFYADWDTVLFEGMNVLYSVTPPTIQDTRLVQKSHIVYKSLLQIIFGS